MPGKKTGQLALVVLTLSSAVAGSILGAVVQNEISGPGRLEDMAVLLLCLTVIGLAAAVVAMSRLAEDATVIEAEINPLIVMEEGRGIVAVDALVRVMA